MKCQQVPENRARMGMSPPTRGAWIEITAMGVIALLFQVAPHTGGVD